MPSMCFSFLGLMGCVWTSHWLTVAPFAAYQAFRQGWAIRLTDQKPKGTSLSPNAPYLYLRNGTQSTCFPTLRGDFGCLIRSSWCRKTELRQPPSFRENRQWWESRKIWSTLMNLRLIVHQNQQLQKGLVQFKLLLWRLKTLKNVDEHHMEEALDDGK